VANKVGVYSSTSFSRTVCKGLKDSRITLKLISIWHTYERSKNKRTTNLKLYKSSKKKLKRKASNLPYKITFTASLNSLMTFTRAAQISLRFSGGNMLVNRNLLIRVIISSHTCHLRKHQGPSRKWHFLEKVRLILWQKAQLARVQNVNLITMKKKW